MLRIASFDILLTKLRITILTSFPITRETLLGFISSLSSSVSSLHSALSGDLFRDIVRISVANSSLCAARFASVRWQIEKTPAGN
jgi:hypothetical protein